MINEIVMCGIEVVFGIWILNWFSEMLLGINFLEKIVCVLNRIIYGKPKDDEQTMNKHG